jgi:hypothetical protein
MLIHGVILDRDLATPDLNGFNGLRTYNRAIAMPLTIDRHWGIVRIGERPALFGKY